MIITVTLNPSIDCSVTVDSLRTGEINRALGFRTEAGGKGVNVSKLLTNLGCENTALGFAGADNFPEYEKLLRLAGVRSGFLTVPGSTRTNIKVSDSLGVTTDINGAGITVDKGGAGRLIALLDRYGGSTVAVSGSLGGDTSPDIIAEIISHCSARGMLTVADTSGKALKSACGAKPHAVKPNLSELAELCGRRLNTMDEIKTAAEGLIKSGIHTVAVSLGEKGLMYVTGNAALFSPALTVDVKCTVGAGDAVTAALAMGLTAGWDDAEILRYAAACGTAAVTMPGSAMPGRETVESFLDKVTITEI